MPILISIDVARLSSTPAINTAWTQNNLASDLAPSFTRKPRMLLHVKGILEVKVRHGVLIYLIK